MKRHITTISAVVSAYALTLTVASASLVMHWKLDEANGDYTGGGYREEVSGSTLSAEVVTGADVAEGSAGLAPGGGSSADFSIDDPDTFINAGSLEADGTHVTGVSTTQYVLGSTLTISGWFNADGFGGGDRIIASNRFSSGTGWMFGTRGGNVIMDFGNTRASATPTVPLATGNTYFLAVLMDTNGDTNFGWTAGSNHRLSLYDADAGTWEHFDGTQNKTGLNLQEVSIGMFTNGGREFDGRIDDVRIYDHTLGQGDLDILVGIPETGPAALIALAAGLVMVRRKRR